ncbi:pirin family protein [Marinobacter salinexigens]|uniref:Pirin family protein n=1 Tax=Marinobacter salinexigens TaxID=2919747 RepID=A0A5B0V9Z8_9GAMM|nr:pirin family protein [Marinobacter salinexigens]KAA1170995.1 pirin family protein [Marinobacter salinexigens]
MSNLSDTVESDCTVSNPCDAIELLIQPKDRDLGGFSVRRLLPHKDRRMVGPWTFFDHMGPAIFQAGDGINVRPHPHINLATVTYLFEGEILHRDSLGSVQPIRPGDINLMVAGKGIVHSERERPEITAKIHTLHGLQLWLALPKALEEMEPDFLHYPADAIPTVNLNGVPARVIMGTAYGVTSPVKCFAETLYVEAHLAKGQSITLPTAKERALYVAKGTLAARDAQIPEYSMAILGPQEGIEVVALEESRIAIIGGEPFEPRRMDWNFISTRKERIVQARADWKAHRFPLIPGDDEEFIPLPE